MNLLVGVVLGVFLGAPPPVEIRKAANRIRADDDYQITMPGRALEERPSRPRATGSSSGSSTRRASTSGSSGSSPRPSRRVRTRSGGDGTGTTGGTTDVGNALLWILVCAIAVIVAAWLIRLLGGPGKDVEVRGTVAGLDPPAPLDLGRTKTHAERLADEGRYAESIHFLLLETLEQLARRLPGGMRTSWTSREVLRQVKLPAPARAALGDLVEAVETTLFGHDVPGHPDYLAATRAFTGFANAMQGDAPGRATA